MKGVEIKNLKGDSFSTNTSNLLLTDKALH